MNFWNRVEELLDKNGKNKKELADAAGIDPSTISKGLQNKSAPSADKAVLIAQFLNTTVEYLVTGNNSVQKEINDLYKHQRIIQKLDKIPEDTRTSIELMISDLSDKYSPTNK